jgi:hypothetical protein
VCLCVCVLGGSKGRCTQLATGLCGALQTGWQRFSLACLPAALGPVACHPLPACCTGTVSLDSVVGPLDNSFKGRCSFKSGA